jgi:hypothetical protein
MTENVCVMQFDLHYIAEKWKNILIVAKKNLSLPWKGNNFWLLVTGI